MAQKLRLILITSVVILTAVTLKAVLFVTAKPKISVNYIAEYNAITLPANYEPNKNAAPYYQKAFDAFVKMPRQLMISGINWPSDFNDAEQVLFQKWLTSNSRAFEQFKIAANKPYYWLERQANKDVMIIMAFPIRSPLYNLIRAVIWEAKQSAIKGHTQAAFENILDCYRTGCQECRTPSWITEQESGLGDKQTAMYGLLIILDRTTVDRATLKSLQDALNAELNKDTYLPDMEGQKPFIYDMLQRMFVDNGRGTGRFAWNTAKNYIGVCGQWNTFEVLRYCLVGPTRNQMVKQIDDLFASFDSIKAKTPKQLQSYDCNYFMKIDIGCENDLFLGLSTINLHNIYYLYHQTRSRTDAVITVIAILRYKADTGQYPESLGKLVSAGYLQSLPMDPYSDGPLVYKVAENNFKLYSVGENFKDDGGTVNNRTEGDIIYWPVPKPERPKLHLETEKPIQKTDEPNQPK